MPDSPEEIEERWRTMLELEPDPDVQSLMVVDAAIGYGVARGWHARKGHVELGDVEIFALSYGKEFALHCYLAKHGLIEGPEIDAVILLKQFLLERSISWW